ncbi:MAG: F0F1 ATP synthase subunit alpha [Planctomycetota bacterium]
MSAETITRAADDRLAQAPDIRKTLADWREHAAGRLADLDAPGRVREVGRIRHVADGVATVAGLGKARYNELLRFPTGVTGLVFNLDADRIGCVLLGDDEPLSAGDTVEATGRVVSVPVGEALLGRVVNALGEPVDGEGPIRTDERLEVEQEAPAILERAAVRDQVVTGIKAIDALVPIGRGQRELIVGDRATGKTALAVDAIVSQRHSEMISIYVAIGQKAASVKAVSRDLLQHGAPERTLIVAADADDPPGLQYLAPYAATAMGEHFMRQGRDVLVVYDDLTRHARAYREVSLLLRRPPGREAYPGDIFFVHSRLLERATRLCEDAGGGTLTALPIVETQAKNMAAYIPTNLISITDGQILLDPDLFAKGIKPAIDVGRSVSRVGGKTQLPSIRSVAKELRLQYARFEELELFTRFGATVEQETRKQIERGRRIRELLKQLRLQPLSALEETAVLLSVDQGQIDDVPTDAVSRFAGKIRDAVRRDLDDLADAVESGEELDEDAWDRLRDRVSECAAAWASGAGGADATGPAAGPPDGDD